MKKKSWILSFSFKFWCCCSHYVIHKFSGISFKVHTTRVNSSFWNITYLSFPLLPNEKVSFFVHGLSFPVCTLQFCRKWLLYVFPLLFWVVEIFLLFFFFLVLFIFDWHFCTVFVVSTVGVIYGKSYGFESWVRALPVMMMMLLCVIKPEQIHLESLCTFSERLINMCCEFSSIYLYLSFKMIFKLMDLEVKWEYLR